MTPVRAGLQENWQLPDATEWRQQILVPFCWESLAAWGEADAAGNENYYSTRVFLNPLEVTRANHRAAPRYEVGWYRREVEIPDNPSWAGKRVIVTVGAADFFTDCWCNGQHLGRHEGGYTPFEFDLTDSLQPGKNGARRAHIVLRVEDPMDNREQPVGKQWRWYTPVSGIWQTVFVEPRHATHIDTFRFTSDIDAGTIGMQIRCASAGEDCVITGEISSPEKGPKQHIEMPVVKGVAEQTIKLDKVYLWGPNEPHLYPTVLTLAARQPGPRCRSHLLRDAQN